MRIFAYQDGDNVIIERVLKKGFRKPVSWLEIEEVDIPPRDSRQAWAIVDGALIVDQDKMVEVNVSKVRKARADEYPDIGDQLDAIMKWAFTETEITLPAELVSLAGKCMSIKSKYPMP